MPDIACPLSATLVLYHAPEDVLDTVCCIQRSSLPVKLYVVDNSPADSMAARIHQMRPEAQIMAQQQNVGFGKANNAVLPLLNSRYHLIVNPDIRFESDLLQRMVDYMDAHPQTVILTPRVFNPDGTEQFLPKQQPSIRNLFGGMFERFGKPFSTWRKAYTLADYQKNEPIAVSFATGCFILIRTEAFVNELKGFDERFFLYHEDSDLSRRTMSIGEITYHPQMHVTHRWARENTRTLHGTLRQMKSTIQFFHKWGWKW